MEKRGVPDFKKKVTFNFSLAWGYVEIFFPQVGGFITRPYKIATAFLVETACIFPQFCISLLIHL